MSERTGAAARTAVAVAAALLGVGVVSLALWWRACGGSCLLCSTPSPAQPAS